MSEDKMTKFAAFFLLVGVACASPLVYAATRTTPVPKLTEQAPTKETASMPKKVAKVDTVELKTVYIIADPVVAKVSPKATKKTWKCIDHEPIGYSPTRKNPAVKPTGATVRVCGWE